MPSIDWAAVGVAALASFAVGAVWYSPPLFGKAWQRAAGLSDADLARGNVAIVFGGAFALNLLATIVFAMFLGPAPGVAFGAGVGFSAGLAWVSAYLGINYLFERKSLALFAINAGYSTLAFTVMGAVLGWLS